MPFLFVDDGTPESAECADNYIWYEPMDPDSFRRALELKAQRAARVRAWREDTGPQRTRPPFSEA